MSGFDNWLASGAIGRAHGFADWERNALYFAMNDKRGAAGETFSAQQPSEKDDIQPHMDAAEEYFKERGIDVNSYIAECVDRYNARNQDQSDIISE